MEKLKEGRDVVVVEDNAPAHRSRFDNDCLKLADVKKLLWPPNSPDCNVSEHAWPWLRRHITKEYPVSVTAEDCASQWAEQWEKLTVEHINAWINSFPKKKIIAILERDGDNCFHVHKVII